MLEELFQRYGIVVFRVVGTVKERYWAITRCLKNRSQTIPLPVQLCEVSPAKLIPALRVVMKPFAQFRAWRRDGETPAQLPIRLDQAIGKALKQEIFTDEIHTKG